MMLDALVKDNNIDLTQDRVNFIKDLIRGETRLSRNEKKFLFEIVANKRNGIDVDKVGSSGLKYLLFLND